MRPRDPPQRRPRIWTARSRPIFEFSGLIYGQTFYHDIRSKFCCQLQSINGINGVYWNGSKPWLETVLGLHARVKKYLAIFFLFISIELSNKQTNINELKCRILNETNWDYRNRVSDPNPVSVFLPGSGSGSVFNFLWTRIRFVLRGWIRIRSVSDRIRTLYRSDRIRQENLYKVACYIFKKVNVLNFFRSPEQ